MDSEKNQNIRKNDVKKIKVLVTDTTSLPVIKYGGMDMKQEVRENLSKLIKSDIFHLEQVYTMGYENEVDVIYLGITNIENVKSIKTGYQLLDFEIRDNHMIILGDKTYQYKTVELENNNNIEYIHEIDVRDKKMKRTLLDLIISYKKVRGNIDNTDILFKFMGSSFTLEDVRILYELIKNTTVDKSNFRKKIIKYCESIENQEKTKKGFRPSQKYKFKPLKGESWL